MILSIAAISEVISVGGRMFGKPCFKYVGLCALVLSVSSFANAQLASRPAEEWKKTLEQPSRLESLKVREIVADLKLKPGQVVADLGAGTGLFSVPMAKEVVPRGKVYAVEIDKGYFPMIEGKAKESNLSNVNTVLGEFSDPKIPAQDVDMAFMHDVLHHVEDRAGYIKNAARYIKRDGRFVVIDYKADQSPHKDQPNLIVSEQQVTGWMKAAGFSKVDKVDLFPDKYFLIFKR
jgi:cyclopropane fatty-acyl-phospholipid synthase-like methyltransferase